MMLKSDIIIVGSGTAGLTACLKLAKYYKVSLLCKTSLGDGSSLHAQGGIAVVLDDDDSVNLHISDTLIAGDGLCDGDAVSLTIKNSKKAITWLINQGVAFTKNADNTDNSQPYHLTKEGGHSFRRIIHSKDNTGKAVQNTLSSLVKRNKNITVYENYNLIDVIKEKQQCIGVYALNSITNKIDVFISQFTILATGGASKIYLYSTNPTVSSGDGIAVAFRAGCKVANMEFNQFHPTALYHTHANSFLISESLRGEGAYLKLPNGDRFMHKFHKSLELAPRDIVARAIDFEMKRLGIDNVYLDISHKPNNFIIEHFPNIYNHLLKYNINITTDMIPVVPAAHYTCGGVVVDENSATDIANLYAVGEVSYTGLHGANRMASNSLLECVVFAIQSANHIHDNFKNISYENNVDIWNEELVRESKEAVSISHNWNDLRNIMWNYMGIVRSEKRLAQASKRINLLKEEIYQYYSTFIITSELLELRNLVCVADLMIRSAQQRKESRGLHFMLEYPNKNDKYLKPTIIKNQC